MDQGNARLGALGAAVMIVAAACGGASGGAATGGGSGAGATGSAPGAGGASGEIVISGSSTVQPISQGVQELFNESNPDVAITVDGPGTGDGFQLFCAGEIDIADASRPIRQEESQACAEAGVEYVELKVAIDGLSVITSTENSALECLSFADLYALVGPESEGFATWADAQALAAGLGSSTPFPDGDLVITAPGEESGTFDSFVEIVIAETAVDRGEDETTRADYQTSANDNVIIDGVAGTPTSLGWVGYAFAEENSDRVRLLPVSEEPDGECVEPTPETIASGEYPIARDLHVYVNTAKAAENAALAAYVDFYLADGTIDSVLESVPYVPLQPDALAETRAAWEAR